MNGAVGTAAVGAADAAGGPTPGKYGCSESIARMRDGSFEYEPQGRGFITLARGGRYTDPFGVEGTYRHDAAKQETRFTGGALDQAVATPLDGPAGAPYRGAHMRLLPQESAGTWPSRSNY